MMKKLNNFKRLPNGSRIVKQQSYAGQKQANGTYSLFSPNGTLVSLYLGNNKAKAFKIGLNVLNAQLKRIDKIWGSMCDVAIEEKTKLLY